MILLGTASAIDLVAERGAQIGPSMELLSILDKKVFSSHFVWKVNANWGVSSVPLGVLFYNDKASSAVISK